MMTDLRCTLEPPQPLDDARLEWISHVRYSLQPPVFALTAVDSQQLTLHGCQMQCAHIAFTEPFTRIKKELCAQISENSLAWFKQQCNETQLYDTLELQDFIHVDSSIICIEEDALYDNTLFENTVPSNTFLEHASNVHQIYCMIQAVLFKGTHMYLQVGVSHVRMKNRPLQPTLLHHTEDDVGSISPTPSTEELAMIRAQIQTTLHRKNHKLGELTAIEDFLQSEYEEKINRIRKQQKSVSMEIECLKKTR
jgi:hypothetical protein